MMNSTWRLLGALSIILVIPGCLDLKPAAPPVTRWLTLPRPMEEPAPPRALAVTLRSVEASTAIDDRLILRPGPFELRYDEYVRWADHPEASLRAAIENELYARRGMSRSVPGAPHRTVDLDLEAFEELSSSPRSARVTVRAEVFDGQDPAPIATRRLRAECPIEGTDPTATAKAMGAALANVADQVGQLIESRL